MQRAQFGNDSRRVTMECWRKRTTLEKKSFVTISVLITILIASISLILMITEPDICKSASCSKMYEHIFDLIDVNENPCDNFYDFACGKAWNLSTGPDREPESVKILKTIVSTPISANDTRSLRLQKRFYRSCVDLESIDADNDAVFSNLLEELGGWPVVAGNNWNESAFDFAEFMVELREKGLEHDWFLDISVYSNRGPAVILEINAPDTANKVDEKIADEYVDLMVDVAVAFGAHDHLAKSQMPEVMYFENKLTNLIDEIHYENEMLYRRNPIRLITIAEVQQKWQNLNWLELLNHLTKRKLSDDQLVAFFAGDYMPRLDKLLKQTTKRTQVNYVMWKLVESYSPYLSKKIRELMENYCASTGQTDLWYDDRADFCFEESRTFFQYTLEATYLRKFVTETTKANIEEIIKRISHQVELHLRKTHLLEEEIRRKAISKLQNMSYIIGGPEEMYYEDHFDRDFGVGDIEFNSTNIVEISITIFHKKLDLLYNKKHEDKNFSKYKFYNLITSDEIQFYQHYNLLWIPAGALHGLFYDEDRPNYLNYAIAGTTIAYHIVYSIYRTVSQNMMTGPGPSLENFDKAVECFKKCTDGIEEINCDLLENLADHVSVNVSYEAYRSWSKRKAPENYLSGLAFSNDQFFWLSYASSMCHLPEENHSRIDHMIQSFRIVGPFRNSPHFGRDFKCGLDSNMNPRFKCQIS